MFLRAETAAYSTPLMDQLRESRLEKSPCAEGRSDGEGLG